VPAAWVSKLQRLTLQYFGEWLPAIVEVSQTLTYVNISGCAETKPIHLECLSTLPNLIKLDVYVTGLDCVEQIRKCSSLRELRLEDAKDSVPFTLLSDRSFGRCLQKLALGHMYALHPDGYSQPERKQDWSLVWRNLEHLQSLELKEYSGVDSMLESLVHPTLLPNLSNLIITARPVDATDRFGPRCPSNELIKSIIQPRATVKR